MKLYRDNNKVRTLRDCFAFGNVAQSVSWISDNILITGRLYKLKKLINAINDYIFFEINGNN